MQTIITKYLGPTNYRGSRYKATHTGNFTSVTLNADYSMNAEANHVEAALALAEKLGWEGDYLSDYGLGTTRGMLRSKANSIEGGTSEINLNVVAKRVLGLRDSQ